MLFSPVTHSVHESWRPRFCVFSQSCIPYHWIFQCYAVACSLYQPYFTPGYNSKRLFSFCLCLFSPLITPALFPAGLPPGIGDLAEYLGATQGGHCYTFLHFLPYFPSCICREEGQSKGSAGPPWLPVCSSTDWIGRVHPCASLTLTRAHWSATDGLLLSALNGNSQFHMKCY